LKSRSEARSKGAKSRRHGGRRARAGRPAGGPAPAIDWSAVHAAARTGAPEQTIIKALEIPEAAIADPAVLTRFRQMIARAHAAYELELRGEIRNRGLRTRRNSGSVNALSLQARNVLDWDKQLPAQESEPDLTTARQRLRDLFTRLAENRSQVEGRKVTVLELLHREAQLDVEDQAGTEAPTP
jgi:hypothetical protein